MRAAITRPTEAPGAPEPRRLARIRIARNPSQSPSDESAWASQSRKNVGVPKIRSMNDAPLAGMTVEGSECVEDLGRIVHVVVARLHHRER
jgi:hypothetical protein